VMVDDLTTEDVASLERLSRLSNTIILRAARDAEAADWAFHQGEPIPVPDNRELMEAIDGEFGYSPPGPNPGAEAVA